MQRGINVGNALDGREGDVRPVGPDIVELIQRAGFDTVRIPVRWSAHVAPRPPFTIEPSFLGLVDMAIATALEADLDVVINVHHDRALNADPTRERPRFLALWSQIAARYADHPGRLHFELLNEPTAELTPQRWNELLPQALAVVRQTNRHRRVLIGSASMNALDALPELTLPADDHLVVTIHYYSPMTFTHQGAPWHPGADRWIGTTWDPDRQAAAVHADLAALAAWADHHGVPAFVGEFGAYEQADMADRVAWTTTVRRRARTARHRLVLLGPRHGLRRLRRRQRLVAEPLRTALLGP